jgi:hypothetical protein
VAQVTMSLEEYLELFGRAESDPNVQIKKAQPGSRMKPKRKGKKDPKMAKALKEANRRGRTKSGKLRKGYTQAKIMKMAHKIRRKM